MKISPLHLLPLFSLALPACTFLNAHTQITAGGGEGGIDQNAQLCQPCVDRIDDFYAYRALCRTNNDHIRQLVQAQPDQVVTIKQEKQLDLDDGEGGEDSSRHHPLTAANDEVSTAQVRFLYASWCCCWTLEMLIQPKSTRSSAVSSINSRPTRSSNSST